MKVEMAGFNGVLEEVKNTTKCIHPEESVTITPLTFKDGSHHLERRCGVCNKQLGYQSHSNAGQNFFPYGKHKGQTFDWIAKNERSYFEWFLSQPISSNYSRKKATKMREKIRVVLERIPKEVYIPEVLTGERKKAMDEFNEWRTKGIALLLKKKL